LARTASIAAFAALIVSGAANLLLKSLRQLTKRMSNLRWRSLRHLKLQEHMVAHDPKPKASQPPQPRQQGSQKPPQTAPLPVLMLLA
jgi:hypothetical protein